LSDEGHTYQLKPLHAWAFKSAIARHRRLYYVSYGKKALLYFDIDLHYAWQRLTDGQGAQKLLSTLIPPLFWCASSRGGNGYLKVDLQGEDYDKANSVFSRLQTDLQLYLAHHKNMSDFEIKGKIGYLNDKNEYQWAQYGKLPIHSADWNFTRLAEFKSKETVRLRHLMPLCDVLEANIPQSVLTQHNEYKKSLGDEPINKGKYILVTPAIEQTLLEKHGEGWTYAFVNIREDSTGDVWIDRRYFNKENNDDTRHFNQPACNTNLVQGHQQPGSDRQGESSKGITEIGKECGRHDQRDFHDGQAVASQRILINLDFSDLMDELDAFKRQKEALFRYARYLKRVPTQEEAMQLIRDYCLYSGQWDENLSQREARVRSILKFIACTFDPSKCANGSVNVGKYDEWVRKQFPNGLIGGKSKYLTEDGEIVEGCQGIHVSAKFISVFLNVVEFGLLIEKNQDNTLPHNRAKELWESLYVKGLIAVKFCARKWAVCREEMVKHGIIKITNRDYHPGKAMEWAVGLYFPFLGLWKCPKPVSLPMSIFQRNNNLKKEKEEHNTWLQLQPRELPHLRLRKLSRPPPETVLSFCQ
jgi:hypothetical protein